MVTQSTQCRFGRPGSLGNVWPVTDYSQLNLTTRHDIFLGYECYENARAHWFIFIPSLTISKIWKVIQVVGNPHIGFEFQDMHRTSGTTFSVARLLKKWCMSLDCLGETIMRPYHRSEILFGRSQFRNLSVVKSGIGSWSFRHLEDVDGIHSC
ncbi:hypothetical protein CPB84DRAFT_834019 [Gymnopilus junonius]|uniref:Uncharacterized protein n=1 Tax=Gymnopilus junonius TaxID=109634 RepID=A0A9P5TN99_GYMJU|nr:hypothetical protein CPB84DRAFT_834019 [Gymnopilus junonius]